MLDRMSGATTYGLADERTVDTSRVLFVVASALVALCYEVRATGEHLIQALDRHQGP